MCLLCCEYIHISKEILDAILNEYNSEIIIKDEPLYQLPVYVSITNIGEMIWQMSDDGYINLIKKLDLTDEKFYEKVTESYYEDNIGRMWTGKEHFWDYFKENLMGEIVAYSVDGDRFKDKFIDFDDYQTIRIKYWWNIYYK